MGRPPDLAAQRAYRVVRNLERDTYAMVRATLAQPWRYARTVVDLDDANCSQAVFDQTLQRVLGPKEIQTVYALQGIGTTTYAEDIIQLARWQRHGIIYTVHPATLAALLDTDWSTPIPGEVLARLPHPDPIVVLPEPIRWLNSDGDYEVYEAFGVFGVRSPRRRASSAHPDITHIVLHYFGRVTDARGVPIEQPFPDLTNSAGTLRNVVQVLGCRAVVDVQVDATLEERQEFAVKDMMAGGPMALLGFRDVDDAAAGMAELTRTGLAILAYIASDNLDIERRARSTGTSRRKKSNALEESPTTTYGIGYRVGASLVQAQTEAQRQSHSGAQGDPGRTVVPHVRRAHLHTFRRGPGRRERFVKWLPPIAVNATNARRATPTVHHVD